MCLCTHNFILLFAVVVLKSRGVRLATNFSLLIHRRSGRDAARYGSQSGDGVTATPFFYLIQYVIPLYYIMCTRVSSAVTHNEINPPVAPPRAIHRRPEAVHTPERADEGGHTRDNGDDLAATQHRRGNPENERGEVSLRLINQRVKILLWPRNNKTPVLFSTHTSSRSCCMFVCIANKSKYLNKHCVYFPLWKRRMDVPWPWP